jgi:hypothetical protein
MALIRFNIDTIRPNGGSALGQIWFELPGRAIPGPRWDDFIVFVLDFWRRGIQDILNGAEAPTPFAFMDDPYEMYAVKSGAGFVFRCTFHDEEIFSGFMDEAGMKEFVASYFVAVRAVIARITQEPNWRETYDGTAGTLDDIIAAQPGLEALLINYN